MSNALQNTANNLVTKYGAAATVTRIVEGAYDATTGSAALATVTATTRALLDNYSGMALGDGVEAGDKRLYIAGTGLSFSPQAGDKVTVDGETWVVVRADKINPDGNVYLYDLQVRR